MDMNMVPQMRALIGMHRFLSSFHLPRCYVGCDYLITAAELITGDVQVGPELIRTIGSEYHRTSRQVLHGLCVLRGHILETERGGAILSPRAREDPLAFLSEILLLSHDFEPSGHLTPLELDDIVISLN